MSPGEARKRGGEVGVKGRELGEREAAVRVRARHLKRAEHRDVERPDADRLRVVIGDGRGKAGLEPCADPGLDRVGVAMCGLAAGVVEPESERQVAAEVMVVIDLLETAPGRWRTEARDQRGLVGFELEAIEPAEVGRDANLRAGLARRRAAKIENGHATEPPGRDGPPDPSPFPLASGTAQEAPCLDLPGSVAPIVTVPPIGLEPRGEVVGGDGVRPNERQRVVQPGEFSGRGAHPEDLDLLTVVVGRAEDLDEEGPQGPIPTDVRPRDAGGLGTRVSA